MIDILGFGNLVSENPLRIVIENTLNWFAKALHHSIHKNGFPNDIPSLADLRNQNDLGIFWFSDSISLYTLRDTDECLDNFISTIGWLLFETMFPSSTHLRCGISYGEVYIDQVNSIFVGEPIIYAHKLERNQDWAGGALHSSAIDRISNRCSNWLIEYDVPLKKDAISTMAINWTFGLHDKDTLVKWSKKNDDPMPEDWVKRPDICRKFINTRDFHKKVCKYCK